MDNDSMRSLRVRIGEYRRAFLLAAAATLVAVMSGCAGGAGQPPLTEDVRALAGVTADHGLDPGSRITVESGMAQEPWQRNHLLSGRYGRMRGCRRRRRERRL